MNYDVNRVSHNFCLDIHSSQCRSHSQQERNFLVVSFSNSFSKNHELRTSFYCYPMSIEAKNDDFKSGMSLVAKQETESNVFKYDNFDPFSFFAVRREKETIRKMCADDIQKKNK